MTRGGPQGDAADAAAIGYVVSRFPCGSEMVILGEILALRARGVRIAVFSLEPPPAEPVPPAAEPWLGEVTYPGRGWALTSALLTSLVRSPVRLLQELTRAAREAFTVGCREVFRALHTLMVANYFVEAAQRLGVAHLHAHWATYPALAARTMSAALGVRYTVTTHAHDIFARNPYLRENLERARAVVTISEFNRRHLVRAGVDGRKLKVVPCGIDMKPWAMGDDAHGRVEGLLVAVGQLEPVKGLPHLVDACADLKRRGVAFACHIVGDGSLRNALARQVAAHGLEDRVHLRGALAHDEVRRLRGQASVFVLPSVRTPGGDQDGIPVALIEAMATGLPVVATRVSGIPELVSDNVSGLLVTPGNALELADAIERLLGDAGLGERLGVAGSEAARERHDLSQSAALVHAVLIEAME